MNGRTEGRRAGVPDAVLVPPSSRCGCLRRGEPDAVAFTRVTVTRSGTHGLVRSRESFGAPRHPKRLTGTHLAKHPFRRALPVQDRSGPTASLHRNSSSPSIGTMPCAFGGSFRQQPRSLAEFAATEPLRHSTFARARTMDIATPSGGVTHWIGDQRFRTAHSCLRTA
jgi:hypothetical protein